MVPGFRNLLAPAIFAGSLTTGASPFDTVDIDQLRTPQERSRCDTRIRSHQGNRAGGNCGAENLRFAVRFDSVAARS